MGPRSHEILKFLLKKNLQCSEIKILKGEGTVGKEHELEHKHGCDVQEAVSVTNNLIDGIYQD